MLTTNRPVLPGACVIGADGKLVGQVRLIRQDDLVLDRTPLPELSVSLDLIESMIDDLIVLSIPADVADGMG